MEGLVILDASQLRRLSTLIRNQEVLRINDIPFGSEWERVDYLRDCTLNFNAIGSLLDRAAAVVDEFKADRVKSPIASDVYDQIIGLVTNALQAIPNYTVRKEFLDKAVPYIDDSVKLLRQVNPADVAAVQSLAEDAETFKVAIKNFNATHGSKASDQFAERIKQEGLDFEQLVFRYKQRLGYPGAFRDLKPEEKFLVYEAIIRDSGRGGIVERKDVITRSGGGWIAGLAVLTFTAGMMAWDIYATPHNDLVETATRAAADLAAAAGGTVLGTYIAKVMVGAAAAAAGSALFLVAGFVIGAAIGYLLGKLAGFFLDSVFSSGGHVPSTQNFQIYIAPMPDGIAVARQIARN